MAFLFGDFKQVRNDAYKAAISQLANGLSVTYSFSFSSTQVIIKQLYRAVTLQRIAPTYADV